MAGRKDHPHFVVIDNAGDFEDKMERLIAEVDRFIATREPR